MQSTRPHKSTTHEERFYHFQTPNSQELKAVTVFARKEADGQWYAAPALCVVEDEFNKRLGRTISRRRYFRWPEDRVSFGAEPPPFEVLNAEVQILASAPGSFLYGR